MHLMDDLLMSNDVAGARGCQLFPCRTSLLAHVEKFTFTEDHLALQVTQLAPEGFGPSCFWSDPMFIPAEQDLNHEIQILWDVNASFPMPNQTIWFCRVRDLESWPEDFVYDEHSTWMYSRQFPHGRHTMHHLELFAGGFGGWTAASRLTYQLTGQQFQSVGIEHDEAAAKAFALTHHAAYVKPTKPLPPDLIAQFDGNWCICADVMDDAWNRAISKWQVDFATISSPCQPWSGASNAPGFEDPDGALMLHSVFKLRHFRPSFIGFENVAGFARHEHKPLLFKVLLYCGYKIQWEKIVDLQHRFGLVRARWLALAVRVNEEWPSTFIDLWKPRQGLPNHEPFTIPHTHDSQLILSPETIRIASDPKMLRYFGKSTLDKPVIEYRKCGNSDTLPTFMAQYGSQHNLPLHHLEKFGYLGHFKVTTDEWPAGARHWHPIEVGLLHGPVDNLFIPGNHQLAWKLFGNAIATPHAGIVTLAVVNLIQKRSYFDMWHAEDLIVEFETVRLTNVGLTFHQLTSGSIIAHEHIQPTEDFLRSTPMLEDIHDDDKMWIPCVGWVDVDQTKQNHEIDAAQEFSPASHQTVTIEVPSSPPDAEMIDPTQPFPLILQAAFQTPDCDQRFYFANDLAPESLAQYWYSMLKFVPCNNQVQDEPQAQMVKQDTMHIPVPFENVAVALLIDAKLTFLQCDPKTPLVKHAFFDELPDDMFDCFGPVHTNHVTSGSVLLMTKRFQHGTLQAPLAEVFSAFGHVHAKCDWAPDTDHIVIHLTGLEDSVRCIEAFWTNIIPVGELHRLGRKVSVSHHPGCSQVIFAPARNNGVCPPRLFQVALSVAACRTLLTDETLTGPPDGPLFQIRWHERNLWEGTLALSLNTSVLLQILRHGLMPSFQGTAIRLICNGKQVIYDDDLANVRGLQSAKPNVMHVILALSGGGPAKQQQRTLQQAAVASLLLENGFELKWITGATEQLLLKHSVNKVQHATSQPAGPNRLTAVMNLFQDAGIEVPQPSKPVSRRMPVGAPWNPKRNKPEMAIVPHEYQILPKFFMNQDGTDAPQLEEFHPQTTGVCLLLPDQALPFLRGGILSTDELAIIILGSPPAGIDMPCKQVRFPCLNVHQQMVLLSGYIYQLGSRDVQIQEGDPNQIKAQECVMVAITAFQDDWSPDEWQQLVMKPIPFIRNLFAKQGFDQAVLSMWGKSLRQGRMPAAPNQAQSVQLHSTILADRLHRFLSKSGFNHLYMTPKLANGRLDQSYKVIWMKETASELSIMSIKASNCLGLVRGKNTLGLRFHTDDYLKAWELLCPGQSQPPVIVGDLMYKAEGLPFGTTADMMVQWGEKMDWTISPVRALGPQAWLLRASKHAPPGLAMFNSNAILLRHLPPKAPKSEPVLLGPRQAKTSTELLPLNGDQWSSWKGLKPADTAAPTRSTDGPTAIRLTSQDDKIAELQKTIQKVAQAQDEFAVVTTRRFEEFEQREEANMKTVTATIEALRGDIDSSLTKVMQHNTQLMDNRLTELKQLLTKPAKRPLDDDDQPMER